MSIVVLGGIVACLDGKVRLIRFGEAKTDRHGIDGSFEFGRLLSGDLFAIQQTGVQ